MINSGKSGREAALLALLTLLGFAELPLAAPREYSPRQRSLSWQTTYAYDESEIVRFELGADGVWVPLVTANASGHALRLILDTGTKGIATVTPETIRELELKQVGTSRFLDAAGRDHGEILKVLMPSLELGPLKLQDVVVVGAGPEAVQGRRPGIHGTLGWHAFSKGRVTLDYSNRLAAFSLSGLPKEIRRCSSRWVTRFESPAGIDGLPIVAAEVAQGTVGAEIDTGKSATVLAPNLIEASGEGDGRIDLEFSLGPFPVQTRYARVGPGFEGLEEGLSSPLRLGVGTDILTGFLVTIDYQSKTLVLEKDPCPEGEEE
jgi:predicted aspartyl protease